ncbi:MAG: nucleoside hydrolase [Oscillospiraceae bacterium]|nr:nucleoside hydrolase [Oscillospiraceae bacterium]
MNKIPVVFDSDPGVDDFFAWMLLNSCDMFDIKAVCTVPGNNTLETVTDNAKGIYKLFRMSGTRLAEGANTHMIKPVDVPKGAHGPTGLGTVKLDSSGVDLDEKKAWDVLYEEAVKAKGELQIIAVGPLTNLGIAFFKYPDLKSLIKRIVIMGGSTTTGNMGPFGEANICHDSHAADIVFKTEIPIVMVGLNALPPCAMTREQAEELMPDDLNPEIRKVCLELLEYRQGFPLCDAVTVASIMDDNFAQWVDCTVDIETRSPLTTGMTVCDINNSKAFFDPDSKQPKCKVSITSDGKMFFDMFREMFRKYCW